MPVIRGSVSNPGETPSQPDIPLPLEPKYGGLGHAAQPFAGALLVGSGEKFLPMQHPGNPHRILTTGEENRVAWSEFGLELQAHVRLDQSLHRASSPTFAGLKLGKEEGGGVWIRPLSSEKDVTVTLLADCSLDQDLSKESDVFFKSVRTSSLKTPILRLPALHPVNVGEFALAHIKGLGLAFFDGENWLPVAGNLQGKGAAGKLAVFQNDATLVAATGIAYSDKGLGLGVADPQGMLHVRGKVILEDGVTVGNLHPKSDVGTYGWLEGRPAVMTDSGIKFLGSGEGNVKGKGKAGQLALWADADDLKAAPVFVNTEGHLCAHTLRTEFVECAGNLRLNGGTFANKDGNLYWNDKMVGVAFASGALTSDDIEISGHGTLVGGGLKLTSRKASHEKPGIASFSESFTLRDGHVELDFDKFPLAGFERGGILSREDYKSFSGKADSFAVGDVAGLDGIEIEGSGKAFGGNLVLKARTGTHERTGMVALAERDFMFRGGYAFLRNPPISEREFSEALDRKADRFSVESVLCGRGFEQESRLFVLGGPGRLDIATASADTLGIARFSERDFTVSDGTVSLKGYGLASEHKPGLMSEHSYRRLEEINKLISFHVAYQDKVEEGFLPFWREGRLTASPLKKESWGMSCDAGFCAPAIISKGVVGVGPCDGEASKVGQGCLRFERGALEVSDGVEWVRLKAGGLAGRGKPGALAYWTSEDAVSGLSGVFWDEEHRRLGWGVEKPTASLHAMLPGAHIHVSDTRPSSGSAGARLTLASDDGADLGAGDCLGSLEFGGKRGLGARIRGLARSNWDGVSSPGTLALGTTPEGQLSPQDHLFLTPEGFLGLGAAKPATPLEIALKNKKGVSALFAGAIRVGSSDESSSVVGGGALRYSQGRLEFSDGQQWRALALAE